MAPSFAAALASWHDFYGLAGAGAATLIGLMFVAVTFGASLIKVETATTTRAFLDPAVSHFVQVLVTACIALAPTVTPLTLGGLLVGMGILRAVALVGVFRTMREAHRRYNDMDFSDWLSGVLVPLATYIGLVGTGAEFLVGQTAFVAVAIITVVALLNGIYSAWELMLWLALARARSVVSETSRPPSAPS